MSAQERQQSKVIGAEFWQRAICYRKQVSWPNRGTVAHRHQNTITSILSNSSISSWEDVRPWDVWFCVCTEVHCADGGGNVTVGWIQNSAGQLAVLEPTIWHWTSTPMSYNCYRHRWRINCDKRLSILPASAHLQRSLFYLHRSDARQERHPSRPAACCFADNTTVLCSGPSDWVAEPWRQEHSPNYRLRNRFVITKFLLPRIPVLA